MTVSSCGLIYLWTRKCWLWVFLFCPLLGVSIIADNGHHHCFPLFTDCDPLCTLTITWVHSLYEIVNGDPLLLWLVNKFGRELIQMQLHMRLTSTGLRTELCILNGGREGREKKELVQILFAFWNRCQASFLLAFPFINLFLLQHEITYLHFGDWGLNFPTQGAQTNKSNTYSIKKTQRPTAPWTIEE